MNRPLISYSWDWWHNIKHYLFNNSTKHCWLISMHQSPLMVMPSRGRKISNVYNESFLFKVPLFTVQRHLVEQFDMNKYAIFEFPYTAIRWYYFEYLRKAPWFCLIIPYQSNKRVLNKSYCLASHINITLKCI